MDPVVIKHIDLDFPVYDLANNIWESADEAVVGRYWSSEAAPHGRHVRVKMLWSEMALYIRFDANQAEPLIVADKPDLTKKLVGLWERDVCEIFIATDASKPQRYYEFEAAPTGEWLDLIVDWTKDEPRDWEYQSGMQVHASVEKTTVTIVMKIPMTAFDRRPRPGDVWLGNIFRQLGSGDTRGYLAWQPTNTAEPSFHVPEKFGEFRFVSEPAA